MRPFASVLLVALLHVATGGSVAWAKEAAAVGQNPPPITVKQKPHLKAAKPKPALAKPETPEPRVVEDTVPAGRYYVGRASGMRDYRALFNADTAGYRVMRGEVRARLFDEVTVWAILHGYQFEPPCGACDRSDPAKPVSHVSWRDAAVWANALSEMQGLDAVYRSQDGQPIRSSVPPEGIDRAVIEPTLTGYRLPTIPEWQIAIRGADKALTDGTYGALPVPTPNALGLIDTSGPLAEWTSSSMAIGDGKPRYFVCNETVDGVVSLNTCTAHETGAADQSIGFRLIRRLDDKPPAVPAAGRSEKPVVTLPSRLSKTPRAP
ncbi:formylglycine-generating enzyme family protein [Lichenihabitans psoromatis]|uniref:formylglycine-generating enzyme family protein n=1 Tax=Lichenihabitans psoromatis TaxID=2528642 RepID=UPI0010359837|nr:SUMF1/EgtB/PvdO family nonheme iron enzyme [Lichenihabitans psoromatis]